MELTGRQLAEFRDLLVDSFSQHAMDMLLLKWFEGRSLGQIAGEALGTEDAYLRLIRWTLERGWILRLIQAAKAERPHKASIQSFFGQVDITADDLAEGTRLEQLVDARLGVLDALPWIAGLAKRMGQVCRIEAPQTGGGTGFLVGPDLVLTNYHVLIGVIPPDRGGSGLDRRGEVRFAFDDRLLNSGGATPTVAGLADGPGWLVACSPPADHELTLPAPWTGPAGRLDYALVRLASRPGDDRNRGFVALAPAKDPGQPAPLQPNDPLLILQHPAGGSLKLALDTRALVQVMPAGDRVRYRTNTDNGSSGSPCFDLNWNLVALHQAWVDTAAGATKLNVGVPMGPIAAQIGPLLVAKPKPASKPKAAKPDDAPGAPPKGDRPRRRRSP